MRRRRRPTVHPSPPSYASQAWSFLSLPSSLSPSSHLSCCNVVVSEFRLSLVAGFISQVWEGDRTVPRPPVPLSPSAPPPWRTRLHLKMRRFWLLQYEIPQELKCIQYECLGHAATATATAAATAAEAAAAQPAEAASTAIKHWPWPKPNVGARQE